MSVYVYEEKIGDKWHPWEDTFNGNMLLVHASDKYIKQPQPHEPQFGRFRWTEYQPAVSQSVQPAASLPEDGGISWQEYLRKKETARVALEGLDAAIANLEKVVLGSVQPPSPDVAAPRVPRCHCGEIEGFCDHGVPPQPEKAQAASPMRDKL